MHNNSSTTKYLSFNGTKIDYNGPPKVGFESLASPGQVITISTADGFGFDHKPYTSSIMQTNIGCKQAGTGYTMTTYTPKQFDDHSISRACDKSASPTSNITNQNISLTMGTPFAHRSALNHQSMGSVPVPPTNTAFVGTTDLRNASTPAVGPSQLTIFYAGSVCVYDDVSPEKAQAIMLLAGNGNTLTNPPIKTPTPTISVPTRVETPAQNSIFSESMFSNNQNKRIRQSPIPSPIPISVSIPRPTSCFVGNESTRITKPFSCTNSPSAVSASSLSSGGSADFAAARSLASLASPTSNPEPSKLAYSLGTRVSNTTTASTPSAVPQARKASLARFMEKRKERTVIVGPYPIPVKQLQECDTPASESRSFSVASAASFSLSFAK